MIKRIHSNLFYVKDLEKTAHFYETLGFNVNKDDETIRVKTGDFTLAFVDENKTPIKNESGLKPKGTGIYTYIEVSNVDKFYEDIKSKGIVPRTEPKTWSWGKREFVVKDPDGYKLVFFAPINIER